MPLEVCVNLDVGLDSNLVAVISSIVMALGPGKVVWMDFVKVINLRYQIYSDWGDMKYVV